MDNTKIEEAKNSRREFLKKCGKYSLLTAPVVTAMLAPSPHIASASVGSPCGAGVMRGKRTKELNITFSQTCV